MTIPNLNIVSKKLHAVALSLASTLDEIALPNQARRAQLDHLIREAETWLFRRAAYNERDKAIYRTGAALEPCGGHLLNDIQLTGLDALGAHSVLLLAEAAANHPTAALSELMQILFSSEHGELIREWGRWARMQWIAALHHEQTVTFLESPAGKNPKAAWRSRRPTRRQTYLIAEIARACGIDEPELTTRGDAFDWILDRGNPRYWALPPKPPIPHFRAS